MLRKNVCGMLRRTLLLRCSSTDQSSLSKELENSIKRRHVTDESFEVINKQYLSHPTSVKPSEKLGFKNEKIETLMERFLYARQLMNRKQLDAVFKQEVSQEKPPHYEFHDKFLTDEELDVVERNTSRRAADLLKPTCTLMKERHSPSTDVTKDEGLAWLYNSEIAFVDVSDEATNENRYMTVREVDGTLRHCTWEERDNVQKSFFTFKDQVIPTPMVFEDDAIFEERLAQNNLVELLELLELSYEPDHPNFIKRHRQLTTTILSDQNLIKEILFTRFLPQILQRWLESPEGSLHLLSSVIKLYSRTLNATIILTDLINEMEKLKMGEKDQDSD